MRSLQWGGVILLFLVVLIDGLVLLGKSRETKVVPDIPVINNTWSPEFIEQQEKQQPPTATVDNNHVFVETAGQSIGFEPMTLRQLLSWYQSTKWEQSEKVVNYTLDDCTKDGKCSTITVLLKSESGTQGWRLIFDTGQKIATFKQESVASGEASILRLLKDSPQVITEAFETKGSCSDKKYSILMMHTAGMDGLSHIVCNSAKWEAKIKPAN